MVTRGVLLVALAACVESVEPRGSTSVCEREARARGAECAVVYQCARQVGGEYVELCIREEDLQAAQAANGICWPSRDSRFEPYAIAGVDPPCFWSCAGAPGCNAFQGCWGCT